MELIAFKGIGDRPFICVEWRGVGKATNFELYLVDEPERQIAIETTAKIFNIDAPGTYYVLATSDDAGTIRSNEITFGIENLRPPATGSRRKTATEKGKATYEIVDAGAGYYIEAKISKGSLARLEAITAQLEPGLTWQKTEVDLSSFPAWHSIHGYEYYTLTPNTVMSLDKSILINYCNAIEGVDEVVYCTPTPITDGIAPPFASEELQCENNSLANNATPDFGEMQGYLDEVQGMNVRQAWEAGNTGKSAVVRHLDFGIYKGHEDFQGGNITVVNSRPESQNCDHGTASTGCIAASNNGSGVTGIAHDASFFFYETGDIKRIVEEADAGDIVSLDIHAKAGVGYLPMIGFRSWWDAILNLTEKKVIVILAAGNGGLDVGNTAICPDFGDCGGLLVGACSPTDGRKNAASNFGHYASLINSWGREVTTTGYSDLQSLPGNNRNYTAKYNGTSSATPLCAGALALIQSYAKQQGALLSPEAIKAILALSDNNEGLPDKVGKRPNVKLAMTQVDEMLIAPVAGDDPFPLPSTFIHANVRFEYDRDSVVTVPFDFRNAGLLNAGLVTFYAEEGPTTLEWYSYGASQLKVPISDEYGTVRILYVQASKVISASVFTMNSGADIQGKPSWGFDLRLTCRWLDNMHLPQAKYHGLLPLYVKQHSGTFKLPVKIRIQVE